MCWSLVEAQHRISTLKLIDTLDRQAMLEEHQATKPPLPAVAERLHYPLSTPFRYGYLPAPTR